LILRELAQVGDVDYVAFAAEGRSVEDLSRDEVLAALRQKVPFESLPEDGDLRTAVAEGPDASPREESRRRETTDPSVAPAPARESADRSGDADVGSDAADPNAANANAESDAVDADADPAPADATAETDGAGAVEAAVDADFGRRDADGESADARVDAPDAPGAVDEAPPGPTTLDEHAREVVGEGRGRVRLLDDDFETVAEADAEATFDEIAGAEAVPYAVVIDGEATQRVVDVAAQRGVKHLIARSTGEYVKKPVDVRVRTLDQLSDSDSE
jgi:DNA primase